MAADLSELERRRGHSARRLEELGKRLEAAEHEFGSRACIYVTGSYGRGEASESSDVDAFLVAGPQPTDSSPSCGRLDSMCLLAALIRACREMGFPEFSNDGEYLTYYDVGKLCKNLGQPNDDSSNTLTARLLMVLEGAPILGKQVFEAGIAEVLESYWRDYRDHSESFVPAFLINDILRLWRTFCVNYEARTTDVPPEKKAKRALENFKLKHSRLLTCFSALAMLTATHAQKGTVSLSDAKLICRMAPTDRIRWLLTQPDFHHASSVAQRILEAYESFLHVCARPEEHLVSDFQRPEFKRERMQEARDLGRNTFDLLRVLGQKGDEPTEVYRVIVV